MQNKLTGKKVIVTGATGGIGGRIAWHIAKNGGTPVMIARSAGRLLTIQQLLAEHFNIHSPVYQADLLHKQELDEAVLEILREHQQIHGLINNAGTGIFDYIGEIDLQKMEQTFQLNVFALIRMTKQLLPHFSSCRFGHIINIASQAGKIATPKSAVYAATKHAVLGFTDALRMETAGAGIYVMSVNPGPVKTDFLKTADPDGTYQKNVQKYMLDPDRVAEKVVRYLFTNKREINMPFWMEWGSRLHSLFPGTMERLLKKQFSKK
jgi:short-subunit dehydrogenase